MKFKNIITIIIVLLSIINFSSFLHGVEKENEIKYEANNIMYKVKLALFDRKWNDALQLLNQLSDLSPNHKDFSMVLFFKGKCHEEMKNFQKALENYSTYIEISKNESFKEQANISIIDLNYALYKKGNNKKYINKITEYLWDNNTVISYYAAIVLSKIKDKAIASKAVPILKRIIEKEEDSDLVDRAKIALMRINPQQLKKVSKSSNIYNRMFSLRIIDKKTKQETFALNIPMALAQLAFDSLPEKQKEDLNKMGYSYAEIIENLASTGELLKMDSGDSIIEIMIR